MSWPAHADHGSIRTSRSRQDRVQSRCRRILLRERGEQLEAPRCAVLRPDLIGRPYPAGVASAGSTSQRSDTGSGPCSVVLGRDNKRLYLDGDWYTRDSCDYDRLRTARFVTWSAEFRNSMAATSRSRNRLGRNPAQVEELYIRDRVRDAAIEARDRGQAPRRGLHGRRRDTGATGLQAPMRPTALLHDELGWTRSCRLSIGPCSFYRARAAQIAVGSGTALLVGAHVRAALALGPWLGSAVERFDASDSALGLTMESAGWSSGSSARSSAPCDFRRRIADRPNPTLESSSPMPSGVRPEVVRFLSQVSEIDVDAVVARNDDACARRKRALAEG